MFALLSIFACLERMSEGFPGTLFAASLGKKLAPLRNWASSLASKRLRMFRCMAEQWLGAENQKHLKQ